MALLYANCSGAVRWTGGLTVLSPGMSISDDHPLAIERPDLFTDEAPAADIQLPSKPGRGPEPEPVVEMATREPGEQRQTRAPRQAARPAKGKADTSNG